MKREFDDIDCIEDVLRALIKSHGKDLYRKENSSRLKSFLSDFAGKFPKERKVLNVVIDEGIQEKLLNIDNGTNDEKHYVIVSCCQRLTEDIGFSENRAKEAVNILATGLGWKIPLSSFVESPESKQNISSDSITKKTKLLDTIPFEEKILPSENKKNANESSTIGIKEINAPMTGKLIRFYVIDGAVVTQGQTIAICDSMIEIEIKAVASGKVHFVTPLGSNIIGGQTIAMIQGSDISDENYKNMIDLATSMDSVLSKKYPSLEEISSIIQKGNEMMEINRSLFSTDWFGGKYVKIDVMSQVFSKFNNGSFLWSSMSFWILGIFGLVCSMYLFIDKGIGIFNYSFLACSCGCMIWGFIEGCINVIIDRILIKKNIKKGPYQLNKFSLGNFFIRFILQFLFGGIIGGISAEFVANSTFWYGTAISTVALILNYIYSEGTWDMR